jgi:hypothetical protein
MRSFHDAERTLTPAAARMIASNYSKDWMLNDRRDAESVFHTRVLNSPDEVGMGIED